MHLLDKNILNEFIADIGFTGSLTITKNGYASLDVCCCQQWFESLESIFNITPRKCKAQFPTENGSILYPPVGLTLEQKTAFLIGLIDGDGSVLVTHRSNKYSCLTFFLCGSNPIMGWARDVIEELNLFEIRGCLNVRYNKPVFAITTSGKKQRFSVNI
ncbi:MAG: hypothetical protein MK111_24985 [Crocosphaera sp.]|uniref:Uncharacterized protein n=2 Tax=Crocosphaera watsonii TaxID=263511 RepID=T2JZY4_CROWT|nr:MULTISPECIES: hypothetical protein [Crocosphaera]MCH2247844.1 hypothetical protein [Crocosphaera sp.]CCQ70714.1 hypothetical protein CWATWH0402_3726 [Crocosphaera watsonii WH 0402]